MPGYNLDESKSLSKALSGKGIKKVLKSGDVVQLKHYNLNDTLNAEVVDITEKRITIRPNCRQNEIFFFANDPVVLNSTYAGEYYSISGEIDSVISVSPSELTINLMSIDNLKNIRKSDRFYVSLASQIKSVSQDDYKFGISKNLSLSGVKINCKEEFFIGDIVYVTVNFDVTGKYSFKGMIVRKNTITSFFEYGIEIVDITKSNQATLFHYINQLESI